MVREFLGTDVEGIESVGAFGAVFEQVFFELGEFFAGFVFAEAVASATDPCRLYGENQVLVVGAVEERHKAYRWRRIYAPRAWRNKNRPLQFRSADTG